jgi:hypothetical protein
MSSTWRHSTVFGVDVHGFRGDVAMGLAKDMSEPYAPWEQAGDFLLLALGRLATGQARHS